MQANSAYMNGANSNANQSANTNNNNKYGASAVNSAAAAAAAAAAASALLNSQSYDQKPPLMYQNATAKQSNDMGMVNNFNDIIPLMS